MNDTLLIPTDFTVESLVSAKKFLQLYPDARVKIVLLHGYTMPGSISGLLFFSKAAQLKSLITKEFEEALTILKNKYAHQAPIIYPDLFFGYTQSAFNNYIEGQGITGAVVPKSYTLKNTDKNSRDILKFIKRSPLKVTEVDWVTNGGGHDKNRVSDLFFN